MMKKVVLFLDGFPWHLEDLEDKTGNIFMLAHKVPGEGLPYLEDADIQEVLNNHAAQLSEQITVLGEPKDEDSCAVAEYSADCQCCEEMLTVGGCLSPFCL
jgi:hypothetical protein